MDEFGNLRNIKHRRLFDSDRRSSMAPPARRQRLLLAVGCVGLAMTASNITLTAAPKPEAISAQKRAAPSNESPPKRVPKKKPVTDASRGGRIYDTEPTPILVSGVAIDDENERIAGAKIYLTGANGFGAFGPAAILAETTTDSAGRYAFTEVMLPVRMFPPTPEVVEGKFQVFGVEVGHGFAWQGVRAYRPRPRPAQDAEPEMDRAYYEGEPIKFLLFFEPTVSLIGHVRDDLGNPVAGATVQVGMIDDARRKNSKMWRFELLAGKEDVASPDRVFASITSLPPRLLSAVTDAEGRYEIADLPREASFLAAVSGPPEFGTLTATIATSDREIPGTVSASRNGWNPVFPAPRAATVRAIDLETKRPLANVVLRAYARQLRFSGNDARTDAEGTATLRLPPGPYRLVAEPAADSHYVRTEQAFEVGQEPIGQSVMLGVQRGALVILVASVDDSSPVEGVGFSYETDSSREPHELQSQTVFVDHPRTDRDGVLRAVVAPGRRRLFVSALPKGYEAADDEGQLTDLASGSTTTFHFALRKKVDEAKTSAGGDGVSEVGSRLQAQWRRQNDFDFKGIATYRMTVTGTNDYVITRDEIRDVVGRFDQSAGGDVASWINQHFPELAVRFAGPFQMTIDGQRHRRVLVESGGRESPMPAKVEVFNGAEIVRYDPVNGQVSVDDARVSYVHIDGLADLRRWPLLLRMNDESPHISNSKDQITITREAKGATHQLVADETTGFIDHDSYHEPTRGSGHDRWQFGSLELPDGMIWPRLCVELRYDHDELNLIEIHEIASVEPKQNLPADAFVVALPAGTLVLASDFGAAVVGRRDEQPRSPKQGMATGPVTDAVQFAYGLSPKSRVLWPVVKPGQIAPQLDAAAWITAEGEAGPPDLTNKRVLIGFWSQGCGPCVGELPKLVRLAKQYENSDLVIIGWHESRADVQGLTEFARTHGLTYALAIDRAADEPGWFGALFKSIGVRGIPQAALIDREGRIVFVGYLDQVIAKLGGG
jgi:thiol-disulfide isomerase/thioredoxin